ncbi:hypothetical protein [Halosimplex halophilum]|uniref:hypothetical protein n=1 Tax=Halosimplex halophilum TaxID=2559572 RepID=UPI00107FCA7A|nr:hypothetical protein [Halosimplex halophilum]
MTPDPLYVASVAETVRTSLRNTDDPGEIRRYLYELRDALYEAEFDGDLSEELLDELEGDIDRLSRESLGPVEESFRSKVVDHVYRVERFCQRRRDDGSSPDGSDRGGSGGSGSSGSEPDETDGRTVTSTDQTVRSTSSQNITINFGPSGDGPSFDGDDWESDDGAGSSGAVDWNTGSTGSTETGSTFGDDDDGSPSPGSNGSFDDDAQFPDPLEPHEFEVRDVQFDTAKAVEVVNDYAEGSPYTYNTSPIGPDPSAYDLGQFAPALKQYVELINMGAGADSSDSYLYPDKEWPRKLRQWEAFREYRYGNAGASVASQFGASLLHSLDLPWVVKKEEEVGGDGWTSTEYITYVGIRSGELWNFKRGLKRCYDGFQSSHTCHDGMDYVDTFFERRGYEFLPILGSWAVKMPGVFSVAGRPGVADGSPIRYDEVEEMASWERF